MNYVTVCSLHKCVRRQAMKHLLAFESIGGLNDEAGSGQIVFTLHDNLTLGLACGIESAAPIVRLMAAKMLIGLVI
jgi:hypothetical protein